MKDTEIETAAIHMALMHQLMEDVKPTAPAVIMMRNATWQYRR